MGSVNVFLWIVFILLAGLHTAMLFGFIPFNEALMKKLKKHNKKTSLIFFILINVLMTLLELTTIYFAIKTKSCFSETVILTTE